MTNPATTTTTTRRRGPMARTQAHHRSAGQQPLAWPDDVGQADDGLADEVLRLYDEHDLSYEGIARTLGISARHAERIIDAAYRQRADELARGVAHIDNQIVRRMFEHKHEHEDFTLADLARLAGFSGVTRVKRLLGLAETSATKKKLSDGTVKEYPGRVLDTISVDDAGRLVRAMGYLPCEIPDL